MGIEVCKVLILGVSLFLVLTKAKIERMGGRDMRRILLRFSGSAMAGPCEFFDHPSLWPSEDEAGG